MHVYMQTYTFSNEYWWIWYEIQMQVVDTQTTRSSNNNHRILQLPSCPKKTWEVLHQASEAGNVALVSFSPPKNSWDWSVPKNLMGVPEGMPSSWGKVLEFAGCSGWPAKQHVFFVTIMYMVVWEKVCNNSLHGVFFVSTFTPQRWNLRWVPTQPPSNRWDLCPSGFLLEQRADVNAKTSLGQLSSVTGPVGMERLKIWSRCLF